jgi:UPF0716 protein FxsA
VSVHPPARTRLRWAPLAVLAVAAAELAAFFGLGNLIGFGLTVLLVAAVSLLGVVLLRREGLRAWRGFRQAATAGSPPGQRVTDGVVGLGGALLLAAPGLVTGLAGAALLTPPVRRLARSRVQARAERRMTSAEAGEVFGPRRVRVQQDQPPPAGGGAAEGEVVEGEIVDDR